MKIIKFWIKIILGKASPLVCKSYNLLYHECEINGAENWAFGVRRLLQNIGLNYVWANQRIENVHSFVATVRQTLIDQFLANWRACIRDSSDGKLYSLYKINFVCSGYLSYVTNMIERRLLNS